MQFMNNNDDVNEQVDKEKMALTEAILSIKSIMPEDLLANIQPKPDRYLLIKKFIAFLQYAVEDATNKVKLLNLSWFIGYLNIVLEHHQSDAQSNP